MCIHYYHNIEVSKTLIYLISQCDSVLPPVTKVMESTNHKAQTMLLLRPLHSPTYLDISRNEQLSFQSLSIKQW